MDLGTSTALAVVGALREQGVKNIPVIVISARADDVMAHRVEAAGAAACMSKSAGTDAIMNEAMRLLQTA